MVEGAVDKHVPGAGEHLVFERNDGGLSGGTLERPALKNLLEHVASRKVDTSVIELTEKKPRR